MADVVNVADAETLEDFALACRAGARAIETNRRCSGASYVWDPFGEAGGPSSLPYAQAAEMLRAQAARIFKMLEEV